MWDFLASNPYNFCNLLYQPRNEVLWPKFEVRDLLLWQDVYISEQGRGGAVITGAAAEVITPGSSKGPRSGKEKYCYPLSAYQFVIHCYVIEDNDFIDSDIKQIAMRTPECKQTLK